MVPLLLVHLLLVGQSAASAAMPPPDQARAALAAELDEGTYTLQREERAQAELLRALAMRLLSGIAPVIQWLGDRVAGGLGALGIRIGVVEGIVQAVLGLGAVAVSLAIIYWVLRRVRVARQSALEQTVARSAVLGTHNDEILSLTARRALRAAHRAEDAGDLRLALRYAFWALLLALAERGHFGVEAGRTNREYERLLPPGSDSRALLSEAIALFERCWYGRQPVARASLEDLLRRIAPFINVERGRV